MPSDEENGERLFASQPGEGVSAEPNAVRAMPSDEENGERFFASQPGERLCLGYGQVAVPDICFIECMKLFCKISFVSGVLCIVSAILFVSIYGFKVGNTMALATGAGLVGFGRLYGWIPRWFKCLIVSGALSVVVMMAVIAIGGSRDTVTGREDYVLVLGAGIRGEQVLPTLAARLDRCVEYVARNADAAIIVSGGQGRRETVSEAAAMKKYLTVRGVDPQRIIMEDRSRNTRQNMQFSRKIMDSLSAGRRYTAACVTSRYHIVRSSELAARAGFAAKFAGAPTVWYLYPAAYCREVLSMIKCWLGK